MSSYSKLNKYERAQTRQKFIDGKLQGQGVYVFKNHTNGTLKLPKKSLCGKIELQKDEEFEGDSYFMEWVKLHLITFVKELKSPETQRMEKEQEMNEQKLILDQPDTVTNKGKVEHVVSDEQPKPLNEAKDKTEKQPDVLLNEGPNDLDGIEIIK